MKKIIFFCLLIFSAQCFAVTPAFRGYVDLDNKTLLNTVYNLLVSYSTPSIGGYINKKSVDLVPSSYSVYRIEIYDIFFLKDKKKREDIFDYLENCSKSHVNSLYIEAWDSNNDGAPGTCQPDKILKYYRYP